MTTKPSLCVLGVHPASRGFGWILFEDALSPFDWGTADTRADKYTQALARLDALLDRYQPDILALEAFDGEASRRAPRIRDLCRGMIHCARERGVTVQLCTRMQIGAAFPGTGTGTRTREEVAAAIARRIDVLRPRLPQPRPIWKGEHPNMALFAAAACALACFQNGADPG